MKKSRPRTPSVENLAPFEKGQVWQIGEIHVAVTQVGRMLVHYKRFKSMRPGTPTTMSSIRDLQQYLVNNKAVLITAGPTANGTPNAAPSPAPSASSKSSASASSKA